MTSLLSLKTEACLMSWCKAVVDEVQTRLASYAGGSTVAPPSTSVSTPSQTTAYNQPVSVSYGSSEVHGISHYPQQQPTVYSQHPGASQYLQQPYTSVSTDRQPASVLQYPQQSPGSQYIQQPAAQPQPYYNQTNASQSLQVPNIPQYYNQPPVSQPSQQSSAFEYPYQSSAGQTSAYQAPSYSYWDNNIPSERPMATYASVASSHLPQQPQRQPLQQQKQDQQQRYQQAYTHQVTPSTADAHERPTYVSSEHGNYRGHTQHDIPGYPQQVSDNKSSHQMAQQQGVGTSSKMRSSNPPFQRAIHHQPPVHYSTPSTAAPLPPARTKDHNNQMRHKQQRNSVATRHVPENSLIEARRAAYASRMEIQQPWNEAAATPQPDLSQKPSVNMNDTSKSSMLPGTKQAVRDEAPGGDTVGRNWPDSLDKYVKRCFALATTQAQQVEVGTKLRDVIGSALEADCLWTKNWESEPLPDIFLVTDDSSTPTEIPNVAKRKRQRPKKSKAKTKNQELVETGGGGPSEHKLVERMKRFAKNDRNGPQATATPDMDYTTTMETGKNGIDNWWDLLTVKGTCTNLEKEYLRLTSVPDPAIVRPEPVLRQALDRLLQKWELRSKDPKGINYEFICSQLKAIRQDLTIQRIRNDLTIKAYECHARIAICEGDLNEFNQCQTQLHLLRREGLVGRSEDEFVAYRILYYVYLMTNERYGEGSKDMLQMMMEVHSRWSGCSFPYSVAHALQVRKAMALGDYHMWFILLKKAPNLSGKLMQGWANKTRLSALRRMIRAYKPGIPVDVVVNELSFSSNGEALDFFMKYGIVVKEGEVDCKASKITAGDSLTSDGTLL